MHTCFVLRLAGFSALLACTAPALAQMHWTPRATFGLPQPRSGHGIAYDSARQRLVVFGGMVGITPIADLWEWSGSTWQSRPVSGPAPRSNCPLVYDAARGRVLLHGGLNFSSGGSLYFSDTWEWDGQSWALRSQAGPQAIASHGMDYDAIRGVTVLFGGYRPSTGRQSSEVWEWDGSAWRNVATSGGPGGREAATLTFVPTLGESLLVGGYGLAGVTADLWSWNGARWLFRGMGPAVGEHGACWNPARDRLVVRGGRVAGGYNPWTWEWDGTQWMQQDFSLGYRQTAVAYDAARGEVLQFGGHLYPSSDSNAFLEFAPTVLPNVQAAGNGCGTPVLTAPVAPLVGQSAFGLRVQQAAGYRAVLMALSTQQGSGQTFGACTVVPDLRDPPFVAGATDAAGNCWYAFPLPSSTAIRGLQFHAQAAVLDGSGPLLGVGSLSNALQVRVGD